ncbi:MAG TPA: hypothetical protein VKE22_11090 [Haliangiales bacterium]|nr:hypothetical protein [Haliangiales bacterium]
MADFDETSTVERDDGAAAAPSGSETYDGNPGARQDTASAGPMTPEARQAQADLHRGRFDGPGCDGRPCTERPGDDLMPPGFLDKTPGGDIKGGQYEGQLWGQAKYDWMRERGVSPEEIDAARKKDASIPPEDRVYDQSVRRADYDANIAKERALRERNEAAGRRQFPDMP